MQPLCSYLGNGFEVDQIRVDGPDNDPKCEEAQPQLAEAFQQKAVAARDAVEAVGHMDRSPEGTDGGGAEFHGIGRGQKHAKLGDAAPGHFISGIVGKTHSEGRMFRTLQTRVIQDRRLGFLARPFDELLVLPQIGHFVIQHA